MIEYASGNLLNFTGWNVACHCCSCQNTFGSGLAKQIKEEFPAAFRADTEAAEAGSNQLGRFSVAEVAGGKRVVNLYAQFRYGRDRRHLDYEALHVCLTELEAVLAHAHKEGRIYVLGIPFNLGCGEAGGAWPVVEAHIKSIYEPSPIKAVIVRLPAAPLAVAAKAA